MPVESAEQPKPPQTWGDSQHLWLGGVRSDVDPIALDDKNYPWSYNMRAVKGVLHTRPAMQAHAHFPVGWPQAMGIFETIDNKKFAMVVISGAVFISNAYPWKKWRKLDVQMWSQAKQVYLESAVMNARTKQDGSIEILDPYVIIVISDRHTRTKVYNTKSGLIEDQFPGVPNWGIPICGPCKWVDSRLWVLSNNAIQASNIKEPDKFTESQFISGGGGLPLPRYGTALGIPYTRKGLLAFTNHETIAIQTNILDRDKWQSTPGFTETIFPLIGCSAPKSFTSHFGVSVWMMGAGMISLDDALNSYRTSKLMLFDQAMEDSKLHLARDLTLACAGSHRRYIVNSVPSGSRWNRDTWLYDDNNVGTPGWAGIWRGIHPVEWASWNFAGIDRSFCLSIDDPRNPIAGCTLWEIFADQPTICTPDFESQVTGRTEFGLLGGAITAYQAAKPTTNERVFAYAQLELVDMYGPVEINVWMAPARTRTYRQVMHREFHIGTPLPSNPMDEFCRPKPEAFIGCRPEGRVVATEEWRWETDDVTEDENERKKHSTGDRGYLLLVEVKGRVGIRNVKVFTRNGAEDNRGEPNKDECEETCVSERGATVIDCEYLAKTNKPMPDAVPAAFIIPPAQSLLWEPDRGFLLYVGDSGVTEGDQFLQYVQDLPES